MRTPFLRGTPQPSESWLTRIRDNLGQLLIPVGLSPGSANGAPIHLLKFTRTNRPRQAQTISLATHLLILALLAVLMAHPPGDTRKGKGLPFGSRPGVLTLPLDVLRGFSSHPSEGSGSGGGQTPVPATQGNLWRPSSMQILKPSLPQNQRPELPVPPSLLDSNAPAVLITVENPGLPWMAERTHSPGPGPGHTIGSSGGPTVGDSGPGPAGYREKAEPYGAGTNSPSCSYCPLPIYTDEARQVKIQGTVTLRVLVGPDGRAADIRVVRGVGYGLEERAVQTVRGWKFNPARDANHRPAASWVTIEAVFRLF